MRRDLDPHVVRPPRSLLFGRNADLPRARLRRAGRAAPVDADLHAELPVARVGAAARVVDRDPPLRILLRDRSTERRDQ